MIRVSIPVPMVPIRPPAISTARLRNRAESETKRMELVITLKLPSSSTPTSVLEKSSSTERLVWMVMPMYRKLAIRLLG